MTNLARRAFRAGPLSAIAGVFALLMSTVTTAAAVEAPAPVVVEMTPELHAEIQKKIDAFQAKYNIAGMSVAVVTPAHEGADPVVTRFAVGTPTLGSSTPVDSSTQFEIASQTKVYTSDLLTYLVADGRVSLDDPVQKYAPEGITVPVWTDPQTGATSEIRLRDLATHQAALPDSPANYWEPCDNVPNCENPLPDYTQQMLWSAVAAQPLLWQPGTNWLYSNFGFGLLGTILANVVQPTAQTEPPAYQSALEEAFLLDLGLTSTMLGIGPRMATPYTNENAPTFYWNDINALGGMGGLVSDADDQAIWAAAHLGYIPSNAPLGVHTMADTLRPVSTITTICSEPTQCQPASDFQMGLAWQLYPGTSNNMGVDWAFKNGGTGGFSSDTTLAPSRGVGVTTMWNQERPDNVDTEPGIELLSLILNYHPKPAPGPDHGNHGEHGDHGRHGKAALAESGTDASALVIIGLVAAAFVTGGGAMIVRRRIRGADPVE